MIVTTRFDAEGTRWVGIWVAEPSVTKKVCQDALRWIDEAELVTRTGGARYVLRTLWKPRALSGGYTRVVQTSRIDGMPVIVEAPAQEVTIRMPRGIARIERHGVLVRVSAPECAGFMHGLWQSVYYGSAQTRGAALASGSWIAGYEACVSRVSRTGVWVRTGGAYRSWMWHMRGWGGNVRIGNGEDGGALTDWMAQWLVRSGYVRPQQIAAVEQAIVVSHAEIAKKIERYTRGLRRWR